MKNLTVADFHEFFQAIHDGGEPFPWQEELARLVFERGKWPPLLDLPTGAGKTAAIDVAVFHLALEADRGTNRRAPLRIFFVIDRRIVVDAAYARARKIAEALRNPKHPIVQAVAERLVRLSGDLENPLDVVRLRGGVPQERDWARSPAQPLVAVSTVDQVGSRLLFRGYGVSPGMRPVHAGLVGADALWLLDEVHLSRPFEQTLDAIVAGHETGVLADQPRSSPFVVVKLSATPGQARPKDAFPGNFDIRENAPEIFLKRLQARKITELIELKQKPSVEFAEQALRLAGLGDAIKAEKKKVPPVSRTAVVVNRVALARQIFQEIRKKVVDSVEVLLLTGRTRPLDRENVLQRLKPLYANAHRSVPDRPIILVATQTIEAGADFDVDALITEIAPLDCLRQRFGRLDRLGLRGESRAVILYPSGKPATKKDKDAGKTSPWTSEESIYGEAPWNTFQWLKKFGKNIDFGTDALGHDLTGLPDDKLMALLAPAAQAPVLLPPYVALWNSTSPASAITPEPALFLHGPGVAPEVQLVWRADVIPGSNDLTSLEFCLPSVPEVLSLPVWAVRRWLKNQSKTDVADVPEKNSDQEKSSTEPDRQVLRLADNRWEWIVSGNIRPGDLVVIPANYGGCDEWGWNPDFEGEVADLGAEACFVQRRKGVLRISSATLENAWKHDSALAGTRIPPEVRVCLEDLTTEAEEDITAETALDLLLNLDLLPKTWRSLLEAIRGRRIGLVWHDAGKRSEGFTLFSETRILPEPLDYKDDENACGVEAVSGSDRSSEAGADVLLVEHLSHTAEKTRDFCRRVGVTVSLSQLLILAALFHDLGKADPRFQADLRDAGSLFWKDPVLAALLLPEDELLAKSVRKTRSRNPRRATPAHFRHEALSVALAEKHPKTAMLSGEDRDLLLWLIGTHHGHGRPFFPSCEDLALQTESRISIDGIDLTARAVESPIRLDQGWFERAERLVKRFGPWELARLEAVLRLADHAASAEEQKSAVSSKNAFRMEEI